MSDHLDARLRVIPPSETHNLIVKISEIDEFRGWWKGCGWSNSSLLKRMQTHVLAISSAASTSIGANEAGYSAAARGLTRGGTIRRPDRPDSAHALGYAELLRSVFEDHGTMPFGNDLVLQLHARLLRYSHKDQGHRGKFKTAPDPAPRRGVGSLQLRSVDPDLTPRAVEVATQWTTNRLAASEFHPLLVVAVFILEFLAIRPFVDGNGRLSRILTNLLLLRCGYAHVPYASLEHVIAERWTEYYFALRRSQANANLPRPDITPWLNAFLDAMRVQVTQLRAVLDAHRDDGLLSENQLRVLALLERNGEVTNSLVCDELDIPRDTAKQVLNRLLSLNLPRRLGAGRAVRYRRAPLHGPETEAR
ncbi:MAG: hypothetical protein A2W26_05075 [Acidobacteria bacterium RBG_16_64_8]|nr:MAG: hypothetical protein A2W26_05075 [Acidobacteria bacterium RBG_16_64_8]